MPTLNADQVKALRAPFAPKRVKFRVLSKKTRDAQGRVQLARYVTTDDMTDRLDEVLPGQWSNIFDVTRFDGRGVPVEAKAAILIGDIRREALGAAKPDDFDQAKQAKSVDTDAFKRAAYRWGVASYLRTLRPCWAAIRGDAPNAAELVELRKEYAELVGMTVDGDLLSADDFDDDPEGETPTFGDDSSATEHKAQPAAQPARTHSADQGLNKPATAQASTPATQPAAKAALPSPDAPDLERVDFFAEVGKLGLSNKDALDRLGVRSVAGLNLREALATLQRMGVGRARPGDPVGVTPADAPDGPERAPERKREGPEMSDDDRAPSGMIAAFKAETEREGRDWSKMCVWIAENLKDSSGHTIATITVGELRMVKGWIATAKARGKGDAKAAQAETADPVGPFVEVGAPA